MTPEQLRQRTKEFGLGVVRFGRGLPACDDTRDITAQLRRAAIAVGADYRAAGRARSHREFVARIGVVLEEADESLHWLEFLRDAALADGAALRDLTSEATELAAIFSAAYRTAKNNR